MVASKVSSMYFLPFEMRIGELKVRQAFVLPWYISLFNLKAGPSPSEPTVKFLKSNCKKY